MGVVQDYYLSRQLNHTHVGELNNLYIKKAGDTATGTIYFPVTNAQGCVFVASINASTCQIQAVRVSIADAGNYYTSTNVEGALQEIGAGLSGIVADIHFRRVFLMMGA